MQKLFPEVYQSFQQWRDDRMKTNLIKIIAGVGGVPRKDDDRDGNTVQAR